MSHDPLCEWSTPCIHGDNQQHSRDTENLTVPDATYCWVCGADCTCDEIAKVRQDQCSLCCTKAEAAIAATENAFRGAEQAWYRAGEAAGYERGQRDMLAECIEAVEALSLWDDTGDPEDKGFMGAITETLDALHALEEKP